MKIKTLFLLTILSSAKLGWAGWGMILEESRLHLDKVPCVQDSTWSVRWVNLQGSDKLPGQMWVVENGTSTVSYTLKEFVESGRFCEWRGGHAWWPDDEGSALLYYGWNPGIAKLANTTLNVCPLNVCLLCGRCRRIIKVNKQAEELEP